MSAVRAVELVDNVLSRRNEAGYPATQMWRGSLLGGCLRRQVAESLGIPHSNPVTSPETLRVFQRGHTTAAQLTAIVREHPEVLGVIEEAILEWPEQRFGGHADLLIFFRNGETELWEVKSVNERAFGYIPKPEHFIQAAAYEVALQTSGIYVTRTKVIYISADSWRMQEFEVPYDERERAHTILKALNRYRDAGRLPPRLRFPSKSKKEPRKTYPCSYCPLLDWCRPDV